MLVTQPNSATTADRCYNSSAKNYGSTPAPTRTFGPFNVADGPQQPQHDGEVTCGSLPARSVRRPVHWICCRARNSHPLQADRAIARLSGRTKWVGRELEVADVFRRYGDAYRERYGGSSSTAQRVVVMTFGDRDLPDGGARWPCRAVGHLRSSAHLVLQLQKPALPGSGQSLARAQWLDDRRAEILDYHTILPRGVHPCRPLSWRPLPCKTRRSSTAFCSARSPRLLRTIAADPKHLWCGDRLLRRAPHVGVQFVAPIHTYLLQEISGFYAESLVMAG